MAQYALRDRQRDNIISRRASFLCRSRLGPTGVNSLILPRESFESAFVQAFTQHERGLMASNAGLIVPTYDEHIRVFDCRVVRQNESYELTEAARGWGRLSFVKDFRANTIVSLWIYREPMQLGPIMKLPHLLVLTEDDPFCHHCQRKSKFHNF